MMQASPLCHLGCLHLIDRPDSDRLFVILAEVPLSLKLMNIGWGALILLALS